MGESGSEDRNESDPRLVFPPAKAALARNPELRRKLKTRIREREERRARAAEEGE